MEKTNTVIKFIKNTAKDYDMSYDEVEKIYDEYYESGNFYEELERFIKNRSEND